jgi:hypothetical protein
LERQGEKVEERILLAGGPVLVGIIPNEGDLITDGQRRDVAPRELTFRFNEGQAINPATLSAIQITQSVDAVFGNSDDVRVTPGFVGVNKQPNQNEVVFRFAEPLPDALYQIRIVGTGASPLRNTSGQPFNMGMSDSVTNLELDLGPQILAIVPQPITRNPVTGVLTQSRNTIEVYFNRDPLIDGSPLTDPRSAENPVYYQLIRTNETATTTDDSAPLNPTSVDYDPVSGRAVLTFGTVADLALLGTGSFRLRIGDTDAPLPAPLAVNPGADPGSTFGTAFGLATLGAQSQIVSSAIDPQAYTLAFPGSNYEVGHRDLPSQNHFGNPLQAPDTTGGVNVFSYNFRSAYGFDPQGNTLFNLITDAQKQRTREVLELIERYMGIRFVETANSGFTVATGDLRAVDINVPTGPGGAAGIAGAVPPVPGGMPTIPTAIMDNAENWGNSEYGGAWFRTAMHEILHLIGLGHTYELAAITIMGSAEDSSFPAGEPVFPGDHDITHGQHLYRPDVKDIDLYSFQLTSDGQFSAETIAERRIGGGTSFVDTLLTLFSEEDALNVPAGGGSAVADTQFILVAITNPGGGVTNVRFEFDDNGSAPGAVAIPFTAGMTQQALQTAMFDAIRNAITTMGLNMRVRTDVNQVILTGPIAVDAAGAPNVVHVLERDELARNDDYYSEDSYIDIRVPLGKYFIAVSASGNDQFDPNVPDSGIGGRSQGPYDLRLNFRGQPANAHIDADNNGAGTTPTALDGDADGRPGGTFNFWFNVQTLANTLFVDKTAVGGGTGNLAAPFNNIPAAFAAAAPGQIVRVLANGGADRVGDGGASRLFAIASDGSNDIVELDRNTARQIGRFAAPALVGANVDNLAFDGHDLYFVDGTATPNLWKLDPNTGAVRQTIPVALANYDGLAVIGRRAYLLDVTSNDITVIDVDTAAVVGLLDINGINGISIGGGMSGITGPDGLIARAGTSVVEINPTTGVIIRSFTPSQGNLQGGLAVAYGRILAGSLGATNQVNVFTRTGVFQRSFVLPYAVGALSNDADESLAYEVGRNILDQPLSDGDKLEVPQGVTLMIDAGAVFKLRQANLDVGSSAQGVDRSLGAIQVLGTPGRNVYFGSFHDETLGVDTFAIPTAPGAGDWGGLVFRNNLDIDEGRAVRERDGIFLDIVNQAAITHGGGSVVVNSVQEIYTPIHLVEARPTISYNTITQSADASMSADPNSFADSKFQSAAFTADYERIGPDIHGNRLALVTPNGTIDSTLNALFIRIRTPSGSPLDVLELPARLDDRDITHVLSENLVIQGTPGNSIINPITGQLDARIDARLVIDRGVVLKLDGSRIEVGMSAQLIAEGQPRDRVIFTSLHDDRFGAGGTFDTNSDGAESGPVRGNWGGIYFSPDAHGSFDNTLITFAGGDTRIEGGFARFNPIEIHQADVRIANSTLEDNASGLDGTDRNGRGFNTAATIFVRGAQPAIISDVVRDNDGAVIDVNVNALNFERVGDPGRSTGQISRFTRFDANYGPLVEDLFLSNNGTNAMVVRGGLLTTQSVWDDTGIVHVLRNEVGVGYHHTYSGLRLQSNVEESLVIKLEGPTAGFTAYGIPLEIDDRVGGTIDVIGTPQHPVVFTSINDDSFGAGLDQQGLPQNDTNNNGSMTTPAPGDWRSIRLDRYSNDRNVAVVIESEAAFTSGVESNNLPSTAQLLGELAPNEKAGDDNRRLGFEVHGVVSLDFNGDVDVYSFTAPTGSEAWIDIDRTTHALDSVIEVLLADGTVIARSNDSTAESPVGLVNFSAPGIQANVLQRDAFVGQMHGTDQYTTNPRDAGLRIVLPGAVGVTNTYYVRVRSANPNLGDPSQVAAGQSHGVYQLQVRLREVDEVPGSTVGFANIHFANIGVEVLGQPGHSPLLGESAESTSPNETRGTAQPVGNLLQSDRGALAVGGTLESNTAVDWYQFTVDFDLIQAIAGYTDGPKTWSTIFDIDYADGQSRPDTMISVYDSAGRLILAGRDSDVADDQPAPFEGADTDDLNRGSFGKLDPFIGPAHLPEGTGTTYFVAIHSNATLPTALDAYFLAAPTNPLIRLEPISAINRPAVDRINISLTGGNLFNRGTVNNSTAIINALNGNATAYSLSDVTLYVQTPGVGGTLSVVDPFTGSPEYSLPTLITGVGLGFRDIAMRGDARLYGLTVGAVGNVSDGTQGRLHEINWAQGGSADLADDAIVTYQLDANGNLVVQDIGVTFEAIAFDSRNLPGVLFAVGRRGPGLGVPANLTRNLLYRINPFTGAAVDDPNAARIPTDAIERAALVLVGTEQIQGIAFSGGQLYGVTDAGRLYRINNPNGAATATLITQFPGVSFSGLTCGPANVENGKYANLLFATDFGGRLYAFDTAGNAQTLFANGATSVPTGINGLTGLAFTPFDYNLWHVTNRRQGDAGHGLDPTFDNDENRTSTIAGGTNFYFGIEDPRSTDTISNQPGAGNLVNAGTGGVAPFGNEALFNTFNLPGGAYGRLQSRPVSLRDFTTSDRPTLYFTYFLNTEGASASAFTGTLMMDSVRVFASADNGANWTALATNNSEKEAYLPFSLDLFSELPEFLSASERDSLDPRQRIQELFDNSNSWRQARVSLGEFAGQENVILRFDFSSAGAIADSSHPTLSAYQYGDQYGTFFSPRRTQNNSFEGVFIDDIVIGLAERGEMVTAAVAGQDVVAGLPDVAVDPTPDFTQVLQGPYQLEIRSGTVYALQRSEAGNQIAQSTSYNSQDRHSPTFTLAAPVVTNQTLTLVQAGNVFSPNVLNFDFGGAPVPAGGGTLTFTATADLAYAAEFLTVQGETFFPATRVFEVGGRNGVSVTASISLTHTQLKNLQADGTISFTVTPSALVADIPGDSLQLSLTYPTRANVDGQQFTIYDGLDFVTFEFDNNGSVVQTPNLRAIPFSLDLNTGEMAHNIRDAINASTLLDVNAQGFGPGPTLGALTGERVDLYGAADVLNVVAPIGVARWDQRVINPPIFPPPIYRSTLQGDYNRHRDQGQVIVHSNRIEDSLNWAIVVDAALRDASGNGPHAGPVRNLRELNNQRLVHGVSVENNLLVDGGQGGLLISGDPNPAGQTVASVPFVRAVNNTIHGTRGADRGIFVTEFAGPTILNNVLSNLGTGIEVDGTSQGTTVLGGTLYRSNVVDVLTGPLGLGSFPINLLATDPLFVNAVGGNFYPAAGSRVIDSSINSLVDRPSIVIVTNPLGIAPSPILAPDRDLIGQLRVDDPLAPPPPGLGSNVFKDRGALDRADFIAPEAALKNPLDNDLAGLDQNPAANKVLLLGQILTNFAIQLLDVNGSGIDDSTVDVTKFVLRRNGVVIPATDYTFSYDRTNKIVRFIPAAGVWVDNSVYHIDLDNTADPLVDGNNVQPIRDLAGNALNPNDVSGVTRFTIVLPGPLPPVFSVSDPSVNEGIAGLTDLVFTVSLNGVGVQPATVEFATLVPGSGFLATPGVDYQATNGTLTFEPGDFTRLVTVRVFGDTIDEQDETLILRLSNETNSTVAKRDGLGTILDDDGPTMTIADTSALEGNAGFSPMVFTVTLSGASVQDVTVNFATANGTAGTPADYTGVTTTPLTIPAGQTTGTVTIQIRGDTANEFDEFFFLNLSNVDNATLADNQAIGTIIDDDKPDLSITDVSVFEGNAGTVNAVLTVNLTFAAVHPITVVYSTADGPAGAFQANAPADYVAVTPTTLSFTAGQTVRTITVRVQGDTTDEQNEQFFVNLANPVGVNLPDNQAVVTILDDDGPTISVGDVTVTEGDAGSVDAVFVVALTFASVQDITVVAATADVTALAGQDYVALPPTTLTFLAGTTTQNVTIPVLADLLDELNPETFQLNLTNPFNAFINDGQAIGNITDNDPTPFLAINDVVTLEPNSGTVGAVYTVRLVGAGGAETPSGQVVTVQYSTANGTDADPRRNATAGPDYTANSGTLTFALGETSKTITVLIKGDITDEMDETYTVNLSNVTNALLAGAGARPVGVGTIDDNDGPTISITDVSITESNLGDGNVLAVFDVNLSSPSPQDIFVNFATVDGTALVGTDYLAAAGTLTFVAGEAQKQVTVQVRGDNIDEINETFTVQLTGPVDATIAKGQGIATIVDNDGPDINVADLSIVEGDSGTLNAVFTVSLTFASVQDITVQFSTADGTAEAGVDYTAVTGTLTFLAGVSQRLVTVPVIGDAFDELDETFLLNITNPTNAFLGDAQGQATIVDNDVPSIFVNDVTLVEGNAGTTHAVFTVSLTFVGLLPVTVEFGTANQTASAGSDYTATSGTLTFIPGERVKAVSVAISGDTQAESNETFLFNLTSPTNADLLDPQGVGTISNDDGVSVFRSTPGTYNPVSSAFSLRNSNTPGSPDLFFQYGPGNAGWLPIVGDWNGDGIDTIGLYDQVGSVFHLRNSNSTGFADATFAYGAPNAGWLPVAGDWNGDGRDTIGLFDPATATWFLRDSNSTGVADVAFTYGQANAGWLPLAGDWDADGDDSIAAYNPAASVFHLRNTNSTGFADVTFAYGPANLGWRPLSGDWNADGRDTIAVYEPAAARFYERNTNTTGFADVTFVFGTPNQIPLAGDWNGGQALHFAGDAQVAVDAAPVTHDQAQLLARAAIDRWTATGLDADSLLRLTGAQVVVAPLPGNLLGYADTAANAIYVDLDAAGHGWFVDSTPEHDEEFEGAGSDLSARQGAPAAGRVDLLSVIEHELGHLLGLDDLTAAEHAASLMTESLGRGSRRLPESDAHDSIFAKGDWDGMF